MASWPASTYVRGPVLQWTMCLTTNQKIAGTVNRLTVWVTNCIGTVNTLSVPIQYTLSPPLSCPLPFSNPPSPPSSPTHRYKVKIYRNLKGTKYSSQVHKNDYIFLSAAYWKSWREEKLNQYHGKFLYIWNILDRKHSVILRNSSEYCIFKYNKISWSILISYFVPMNIPRYIDILEPVCRISWTFLPALNIWISFECHALWSIQ